MDDDKLKLIVHNVLNSNDGFLFVKFLVSASGVSDRSVNFDNALKQYYLQGKKDFGAFILELIKKYNFDKFVQINGKD